MPVLPSSHPDDSSPQTPNDGTAETTAGKWPPKDRDPFDPACESEKEPKRPSEPRQDRRE